MGLWEVMGGIGVAISAVAYFPQIHHLAKEHCSAGVSLTTWMLWVLSAILIGSKAANDGDAVFVAMAAVGFVASAAVLLLGYKFRGQRCDAHKDWEGA